MSNTPDRLVPTRTVCARYDIVDRTVDRWVEAGELPPPVYIRGRRYWPEKALDARDRMRAEAAAERV
jgi:predicted DNA-binding transcriptional regulator AlpA